MLKYVKKKWGVCCFLHDSPEKQPIYLDGENITVPILRKKILILNPHSQISLQSHKHRAEIWNICTDNTHIILGKSLFEMNLFIAKAGDKFQVEKNMLHKISNPNKHQVIIFEEQYGMCSELDIKRYDV